MIGFAIVIILVGILAAATILTVLKQIQAAGSQKIKGILAFYLGLHSWYLPTCSPVGGTGADVLQKVFSLEMVNYFV